MAVNNFGILKWKIEDLSTNMNMLYINVKINKSSHTFIFNLYIKPCCLHLYIPLHSDHPKGVFKGMFFGTLYRIHQICTQRVDYKSHTTSFFHNLINRGYKDIDVKKISQKQPPI